MVWFLSEQLTTQHTEQLEEFIIAMNEVTNMAQYVWTKSTDIRLIKTNAKRNYMALVFTTSAEDPIMEVHNKVLLGRHYYFSLIVLVPKVKDMSVVEQTCWYLYRGNFVNSIVYFQSVDGINQLYGYALFPQYEVKNRTNMDAFMMEYFRKVMAAKQDVEGYQFKTPLRQDMPRVFKYTNRYGEELIQGTSYRIMDTFVKMLNGSLREYEMPNDARGGEVVNMKAVLDLVRSKELEFSAHAYALFKTDDQVDMSYPIMVVKWCLMVPLRNSVSTFFYPLQPFDELVWLCIMIVLISLVLMDLSWIVWRAYIAQEYDKILAQLRTAYLDNFCFVLNIVASKTIKSPSKLRFFVFVTIFFHGFFLSANYTSLLGSFLTVTLFRGQINTLEDVIFAQLPVMIIDYELEFLLNEGYEPPVGFAKLLVSVDSATFHIHRHTFNTSFGYFVTDDQWHFLTQKQQHLKQAIFKFTDICFGSYHLGYPIQPDSPVWRDLEYYLFRVHESGLLEFYDSTAFQYAHSAGYIWRLMETNEYTSAGLEHLLIVFILMGATYTLGVICLIGELLLNRWLIIKKRKV